MRLVLWHGYLLEGTGSNIYTQHVARAWGRLGHDVVVVCQEPRPERFALGRNVRVVRPDVGPLLPTFILDRYEGIEARHVADMTPAELELFVDRNARAVAAAHEGRADLVLANHVLMGGPVAARACAGGTTHAVKIHGSELEYAIRGRPQLAALAVHSLAGASALFAGSGHIVEVTEELLGEGLHDRIHIVPPGVDTDAFHPGGGDLAGLIAMLGRDAAAPMPATGSPGWAASSFTSGSSCARRASICCLTRGAAWPPRSRMWHSWSSASGMPAPSSSRCPPSG